MPGGQRILQGVVLPQAHSPSHNGVGHDWLLRWNEQAQKLSHCRSSSLEDFCFDFALFEQIELVSDEGCCSFALIL
jgi:hypothetical protein